MKAKAGPTRMDVLARRILLPESKLPTERQRIMRKLAAEGKSYADIAALFKISRARVHQLLTGYKSPAYRRIKENQAT